MDVDDNLIFELMTVLACTLLGVICSERKRRILLKPEELTEFIAIPPPVLTGSVEPAIGGGEGSNTIPYNVFMHTIQYIYTQYWNSGRNK